MNSPPKFPGKIVNTSQQRVPTKLEGMALAFTADRFRAVQAMLASFARKNVRASYAVENAGDPRQRLVGVALGPLLITRVLQPKMAS